MNGIRKLWVSCLTVGLAVSLLLSPLGAFASAETDSSGSDASDSRTTAYVRLKDQWKGTYLYEADGQVRYGFTAPNAAASQWLLKDMGDGRTRIENRATGHALDMASVVPEDKITAPLESAEAADDTSTSLWTVNEAAGNPGYVNVVSVDYPTRLLNVQTQDGYAHVNDWAQPSWGSALWKLEPAGDMAPVRLVDQWKGGYLYEDSEGKAAYGTPAMNDAASQWYIVPLPADPGRVRIQNRATGHVLNAQNVIASDHVTDPLESTAAGEDVAAAAWTMTESVDHPGYYGFAGADDPTRLLNVQTQDGYAHANNWAQPGWGSALWKPEAAADVAPVRLKDQWKGQYLFEKDGTIQYGEATSTDKSSWWLVENRGSGVTLRNVDSGHYATGGADPAQAGEAADAPNAVWTQAPAKDGNGSSLGGFFTFAMPSDAAALLNVQAQDGYAHANNWAQPTWGSAQWKLEDPAAAEEPEQPVSPYVRIRNNWLQLYLYEDGGIVKYGNADAAAASSQWLIVDADGAKRIQNRATGHYLNLDGVSGSREAVRVSDLAEGQTTGDWTIEDYQGFKELHLAGDTSDDPNDQAYLNVENKLKVLQYGVVNRDWGSPKWEFVAVTESQPTWVRLKNGYRGTYLYEEDGIVKDGTPDAADPASHWTLKTGEQWTIIENRATGHRIANEHVGSYEDPLESLDIDPTWASAQWTVENVDGSDAKVLRSVWKPDSLIHDEDNKGFAQASGIPADWGSAQWQLEAAPELPPELPQGYVRLQSRSSGQYLFENNRNAVLYGTPAASDASSHWRFVASGDGTARIVNRATGDALSIANLRSYLETSPAGEDADANRDKWTLENAPAAGYVLIRSAADGHGDEYVHAEDGLGYAQYDLRSIESGGVQWKLETAPEEATPPAGADEELNGSTPALVDPQPVRIESEATGQLLAEQGGAIAFAPQGTSGAAAEWRIETYNGHRRLKNAASGHYLSAGSDGVTLAPAVSGKGLGAQWTLADALGYKSLANASAPNAMLSAAGGDASPELSTAVTLKDEAARWAFVPVPGDVRYEAADAFATGGIVLPTSGSGSDSAADSAADAGYATGFAAEGAQLQWMVFAQDAGIAHGSIAYRNESGTDARLSLYVNGLKAASAVTFPASAGADLNVDLTLRAGVNTVALRRDAGDEGGEGVGLAALTLADSARLAARGATTPYVTYEAEHAESNGTPIAGDRTYGTFSAESSGREAVKLDATGQFVEFKAAKAANFLNLRYIIPDSPDGTGQQATLSVYVNGEDRGDLVLSSEPSWVYGKYPYSNDPADGDAHRFYDEAHRFVGDIPAGATVRLQKDEADTADYYVVDLAELERAPDAFAMPDGYRSVTEFGAVADDGLDDSDAFRAAIAAAETEGIGLWVPAGTFDLSGGPLEVRGVAIRGAGMWHTTLRGEGFKGVGSDVRVYDLAIDVGANGRHDALPESGFDGAFGTGSVIQNVWIEHAKAGIWTTLSDDLAVNTDGLYVGGVRVRDTFADGIHLSTGTRNSLIEQTSIRNSGDDAIALWSDPRDGVTPEQARTENNTIRFNTVQLPWLADNVAVFGGQDNKVLDNLLADTMGFGAGIAASTRFDPVPFSGTTRVERNTLLRTGGHEANWNQDFGAIWLFTGDKPIDADIVIRDNEALDSTFQGLYVNGPNPINASGEHTVTIENLVIDGTGTWGVNVAGSVTGSVELANAIVRGAKLGRTFNAMGDAFRLNFTEGEDDGDDDGSGENPPSAPNPPTLPNPAMGEEGTGTEAQPAKGDAKLTEAMAAGSERIVVRAGDSADAVGAEFSASALEKASAALPGARLSLEYRDAAFELPLAEAAALLEDGQAGDGAILRLAVAPAVEGGLPKSTASGEDDSEDAIQAAIETQAAVESQSIVESQAAGEPQAKAVAASAVESQAAAARIIPGTAYRVELQLSNGDKAVKPLRLKRLSATLTIRAEGDREADRLTAGSLDTETGEFRFAPARIEAGEGLATAAIRLLAGGTYALAETKPATFADAAGHWAQDAIEHAATLGIADGETAERFAPNRPVTRAEFAALLVRALGLPDAAATAGFGDVPGDAWYAREVDAAAAAGLALGDANGDFRPAEPISREQMAVMLARAISLASLASDDARPGGSGSGAAGFKDADRVGAWAREAVEKLLAAGILTGRSSDSLAPQGIATRAEAAVLLERTLRATDLTN